MSTPFALSQSKDYQKKGESLLFKVHDTYNFVSNRSQHVKVDQDALKTFAKILLEKDNKEKNSCLDSSVVNFSKLSIDEAFELLILFHSVNFSYWGNPKWSIYTKNAEILDGSQAMLYVCLEILKDNGFNPENIYRISNRKFSEYLEGNVKIPLLLNRYAQVYCIYSDICDMLNKYSLSTTYDLFRQLEKTDEVLLGFIMKFFKWIYDDYAFYDNRKIFFYKRAQLLVSDIMYLLKSRGITKEEPVHLLGCAEYKIPQILNEYNVLKYDEILTKKLNNKIELTSVRSDNAFEVELRANTLKAIELLSQQTGLTRMEVNDKIWLMSQETKDFKLPYHRSRTTAY